MSHIQRGDICRFKRHPQMTDREWNTVRDKIVVAVEPDGKNKYGYDLWKIDPGFHVLVDIGPVIMKKFVTSVADIVLVPMRPGEEDDETLTWVGKPEELFV